MDSFKPDYKNVIKAAQNKKTNRIPLYEHAIDHTIMEKVLNKKFADLFLGDDKDKLEFFRHYCHFFKEMGYDTVSFECCVGPVMPGSGALGNHQPGIIKTKEDYDKYPWDKIHDYYFQAYESYFKALSEVMPKGMKAIGGVGNGVFECVQDIVGYTDLCYISVDDPILYQSLFKKIGDILKQIWHTFLTKFGDTFAVCRFGDDLGFRTSTLISDTDIKKHIIPQYKEIIENIHSFNKPFLLHSCGNIFNVMDELIKEAKIDAKHSNEDAIAPFTKWIDLYGDRIGIFGGIDTDILCRESEEEIERRVFEVMNYCKDKNGFAISSGNSIPDYVPVEGYLAMINAVKKFRLNNN